VPCAQNMLMHAIDGGNMECFTMLLAQKQLDINRVLQPSGSSDDGLGALHYAVLTGDVRWIDPMLNHRSINWRLATGTHRHTALRLAAQHCHVEIVKRFLALPKPKKTVKVLLGMTSADGSGLPAVMAKLVRRGTGPPLDTCVALYQAMKVRGW